MAKCRDASGMKIGTRGREKSEAKEGREMKDR